MLLAVVFWGRYRGAPVSYWPIFSLSLVTVQTSAEVNLVQFFISTTEERAHAYLKTELTNDQ